MIAWYRTKLREMGSEEAMRAEFPTDDVEAFVHSGSSVFSQESIDRLRVHCEEPKYVGEIAGDALVGFESLKNLHFTADPKGLLHIWDTPLPGREYVAAVDIGGRTAAADYSVVAVLDRTPGITSSVVAQWRGHIDHDLLAWKAAAIAKYFNEALLVIESNTLESECDGFGQYILDSLGEIYPRLYYRASPSAPRRIGFHTNRSTKSLIITSLIAAVRDEAYIERCALACDEMATYCQMPNGGFAAHEGCHDDILMTRAIALYVEPAGTSCPAEPSSNILHHSLWHY